MTSVTDPAPDRASAAEPGQEPAAGLATGSEPGPAAGGRDRRRPSHVVRLVAVGVLVVAAALVALLATRQPATVVEADTPLLGKPAPPLSGTTLAGRSFDMSSLRGRWVFVNFFASWCPPCQQEEPGLVAFASQHRSAGDVVLVGVVFDDADSSARRFLAQSGAAWPAVTDPDGQIALDYGVRGPPETFLVSPDGVVTAHFDGPVTSAGLDSWLAEAQREDA